jgi:diaminopimelate epimerase
MHGIGNDFVLIDTIRDGELAGDIGLASQKVCNRDFGVGADGLILVEKAGDKLSMRMFNPDGSESEMCGNGIRTFARLCQDRGYGKDHFDVQTGAGVLKVDVKSDETSAINMGTAILPPNEIGMAGTSGDSFINQPVSKRYFGTAVSMGNPHLVIFVDDVSKIDLEYDGSSLERIPFFPNRTNVHFAQVISDFEITQRTWERGAGATLACGTGACAGAVAAFLNGKTGRDVKVNLPGGSLQINYSESGIVTMTGEAKYSFEGSSSTLL